MAASSKPGFGLITRKVGPAPAWVWAVAAGLLYLVARSLTARGQAAAGTSAPQAVQTGAPGASTNGGSSAASGQGTAADNLSADLLASLVGNFVDVNSNLVYALESSVGAVEGLGYGAYGLAGTAVQANTEMAQSIVNKYSSIATASTQPAAPASSSSPAPTATPTTSGGQYSQQTWQAAPYYSAQGQAQGAGPAPAPDTAQAYSLGTLRGAGYGSNLSIV